VSLPGLFGFYGALDVASAGAAGLAEGLDGGKINPANIYSTGSRVGVSIIKYPANIYAQSVSYTNRFKNTNVSVSMRRINYGTFSKIDSDGTEDGYYSAGDTWISTDLSREKNDLSYGIGGGLFMSNLDSYNAAVLVLSAGTVYALKRADLKLGLSITNIGLYLNRFTDYKDALPARVNISATKNLKYLPLELNTDISYRTLSNTLYFRLGGIFQLPYNFNIIFGASSYNIEQSMEYPNIKSLLGGTGIGLSYSGAQYELAFAGYSYGTGGWTYGTTFSYKLKSSDN